MKLLLTHGYFLKEDLREQQIMKPYVPLGLLYVSAWLKKHGVNHEVFDSTFFSMVGLQNKLVSMRPDILAIYTNLMTKINIVRIIQFVKNNPELSNCRIVLGGPEVRHHAKNFLESGAFALVVGEGEETMLELVRKLEKESHGQVSLDGIRGLAYLAEGELVINKERELIKDLDCLPNPNRNEIDIDLYLKAWKAAHGYSMLNVNTMRGCPYTCKWCSRAVYGGSYRRRSPKHVVDELLELKAGPAPDRIWFVDDVFTIHPRWLKEFSKEVVARDAIIPFEIISRADRLNDELLEALKIAGCFRIWIGAESGSQKIIDAMDRKVDVLKTRQMIRRVKEFGIEAGTFIMLGYPGETKEDIRETITHLVESNPTDYTITIAYPIKGTKLYNEVEHLMFLDGLEFESSTDRDIDFKRTYPKRYYQHGIKWVQTEVYRRTKEVGFFKDLWLRFKSMIYQLKMELVVLRA